jgi:hypothetical protein
MTLFLLRTGAAGGRELVAVTVLYCHNRLRRTYLAASDGEV